MAKCKICKREYQKFSSMQKVCGVTCSIKLVKQEKEKKFKQKTNELRVKAKTKSQWLKEAEREFNRYIRARDFYDPCISCRTIKYVQYAAGHYFTKGGHSELRFNEDNVHKQCNKHCNMMLSGNIAAYRVELEKKIGAERLRILEGKHEPKNYTIDDIKKIKEKYKKLAKELEDQIVNNFTIKADK